MRSILLIDDKSAPLAELAEQLNRILGSDDVEIRTWIPGKKDNSRDVFEKKTDSETTLVVTDHDLTSQGQMGLFGSSIVAWCQQLAIPVGTYSRGKQSKLPKEPDLFELRVPTDENAAPYIAGVFRGFRSLSAALEADEKLLKERSPAAVLAKVLGVPEVENQFAQYIVRIGAASGALMARISATKSEDEEPSTAEKRKVLSYLAGHLLVGAILRFPGPILSERALKAFVASDEADSPEVRAIFEPARYEGPFSDLDRFLWLSRVNAILDEIVPADIETETAGELYRRGLESKLGQELSRHYCPHCQGRNGGFFCPFTERTVCQLPYCSVGSNGWIPQGAKLCRIEREFFDEWAPILGL